MAIILPFAGSVAKQVQQGGGSDPLANAVWGDEFNYAVSRGSVTDPDDNAFIDNGPWSRCKSEEDPLSNARGYIYTVNPLTGIPGNSVNPSSRSEYVVCLEGLPNTLGAQTDFYLQRGSAGASDSDVLPGDVWIQYWRRLVRSGSQMSARPGRAKFLYPCRDTHGSCSNMSWIHGMREDNAGTNCNSVGATTGWYSCCFGDDGHNDDVRSLTGFCDTAHELGPNDNADYEVFNTWYLHKIHYDTSGAAGTFEHWVREYGSGSWTKIQEWISGVTTDFTWTITSINRRGHNMLRIPTTWDTNDCWCYLADFAVATSEGNLYSGYTDAS